MKPPKLRFSSLGAPIWIYLMAIIGVLLSASANAQQSFSSDAASVVSTTIAETYCSSIDGTDFSLDTYFPNQAAAEAKFGKAIVSRSGGVCCSGANPLISSGACQPCPSGTEYSGGACVATTTSCAAIGQILVNGKCQVADPGAYCPTTEGWFAGAYSNTYQTLYPEETAEGFSVSVSAPSSTQRNHFLDLRALNNQGWNFRSYMATFNVPTLSQIGEFALIQTVVDDHMMVQINGKTVRIAPAAVWQTGRAPWNFTPGEAGLRFYSYGGDYNTEVNGSPNANWAIFVTRPSDYQWYYGFNQATATYQWYQDIPTSSFYDVNYPFIGVTPEPRLIDGGYQVWIGGSVYSTYGIQPCDWFGNCAGYASGNKKLGASGDTSHGWPESFYLDLKPWLVQGTNTIRVQRYRQGTSSGANMTIKAAANPGCIPK